MSQKFQIIVADPAWSFKDSLKMSDVARGAAANYSTMTNSEILQMPIKDYVDPNGALLALWVPSSILQTGLDVMKTWGFTHKQTYVWVKVKNNPLYEITGIFLNFWKKSVKPLGKFSEKEYRTLIKNSSQMIEMIAKGQKFIQNTLAFGMGRLFRQTHEICLIGTNNNKIYKLLENRSQRSISFGENLKHSAKPEHLQDSLELMFPKAQKLELFARRLRPGWTCLGNEVCNGEDIYVSLSKL